MLGFIIGGVFAVVASAVLALLFVRLARREEKERKSAEGGPRAPDRR